MSVVRSILLGDATISGLVGAERVYPNHLPQSPTLPAITYHLIDKDSPVTHDQRTGLTREQYQIDVWADGYTACEDLFDAVRKRLNGYTGGTVRGVFLDRTRDLYDDETKTDRKTADFSFWLKESA